MTDRANAIAAYERDNGLCIWCLHQLGITNIGSIPHHIFGRRWDSPEYQITLCMIRADGSTGCHPRIHDTGDITRGDIIELCKATIWQGKDLTPEDW